MEEVPGTGLGLFHYDDAEWIYTNIGGMPLAITDQGITKLKKVGFGKFVYGTDDYLTIKNGVYTHISPMPDTDMSYPNNTYYDYLSALVALEFIKRLEGNVDSINIEVAEERFYDTIHRDNFQSRSIMINNYSYSYIKENIQMEEIESLKAEIENLKEIVSEYNNIVRDVIDRVDENDNLLYNGILNPLKADIEGRELKERQDNFRNEVGERLSKLNDKIRFIEDDPEFDLVNTAFEEYDKFEPEEGMEKPSATEWTDKALESLEPEVEARLQEKLDKAKAMTELLANAETKEEVKEAEEKAEEVKEEIADAIDEAVEDKKEEVGEEPKEEEPKEEIVEEKKEDKLDEPEGAEVEITTVSKDEDENDKELENIRKNIERSFSRV
jgi:hypothetical protein